MRRPVADVADVAVAEGDFPCDVLPSRVLSFVLEVSEALGVDPAVVAGACLSALAGCVGNRRRIAVKGSWPEVAVLWVVIVAPSGSKKTPASSMVLAPLHEREAEQIAEEQARRAAYEEEVADWRAADKKGRGAPPEKPEPAQRLVLSDITTEALLAVHARSAMGLLLHRDELAGWLRSFGAYKSGRGGDAQTWAEMHQGRPALVDRKTGPTLSVPRACVSIVGGVQPAILREVLAGEHLEDGIASRILFIAPPETPKRWTDQTVSDESSDGWSSLLGELLDLEPSLDGGPVDLTLTKAAKALWIDYYNTHADKEAEESEGPIRSALSKLEAATARLALVVQLAEDPNSEEVGEEAMRAGIALSNYFEQQARRIYTTLEETAEDRDRRELVEWIAKRGGRATKRELARFGPGRLRKRADEVLDGCVEEGLLSIKVGSGKKRTTTYSLVEDEGE